MHKQSEAAWGLAFANYESTNTVYPSSVIFGTGVGACQGAGALRSCQNTPWFVLMLPYIEQSALYNAFNASIGVEGPVALGVPGILRQQHHHTDASRVVPVPQRQHPEFQHDDARALRPAVHLVCDQGKLRRELGNTDFGQALAGYDHHGLSVRVTSPSSPFGINTAATGPNMVRISSITDGTSNTMAASEILQGAPTTIAARCGFTGWRKLLHDPVHPNSYTDYVVTLCSLVKLNDHTASKYDIKRCHQSGTSSAIPGALCDSQPVQQFGCVTNKNEGADFVGSRSRHPGGVNTVLCDGSVRFMKNSINPLTWVGLGSMAAGEVISSDSY